VAKGGMFLAIAGLSAFLLVQQSPRVVTAMLASALVWSSCRFYYFLFHVLEKYVDPRMKYRGVWHLVSQMRAMQPQGSKPEVAGDE
jgi:hypothetical protein